MTIFLSCKAQKTTTENKLMSTESITERLCSQFDNDFENQSKLQTEMIQKESQKNPFNENILSDLNVLNYKTTRELWKNCKKYKLKHYALGSIFTRVLDIDNTLNYKEENEIELKIKNLETKKKVQLMIVTIDDLYPYKDLTEYSIEQVNSWGIGKYPVNGGIIIVLDKKDRNIRLSTDYKLKKELTNKECEEVIEILKPFLKEKKYLEGLKMAIEEIDARI